MQYDEMASSKELFAVIKIKAKNGFMRPLQALDALDAALPREVVDGGNDFTVHFVTGSPADFGTGG